MSGTCHHEDATLLIRAREDKETWGDKQVLQCRDCDMRWSQ
jgi:hypothetical protein